MVLERCWRPAIWYLRFHTIHIFRMRSVILLFFNYIHWSLESAFFIFTALENMIWWEDVLLIGIPSIFSLSHTIRGCRGFCASFCFPFCRYHLLLYFEHFNSLCNCLFPMSVESCFDVFLYHLLFLIIPSSLSFNNPASINPIFFTAFCI